MCLPLLGYVSVLFAVCFYNIIIIYIYLFLLLQSLLLLVTVDIFASALHQYVFIITLNRISAKNILINTFSFIQ